MNWLDRLILYLLDLWLGTPGDDEPSECGRGPPNGKDVMR